jgi:threonine/homoserine/homoserine lactone efflux protein
LATQLSNPKAAVVYGSVFAALLPSNPPLWWYLVIPPLVFAIEAAWYAVVVVVFSASRPKALYTRAKKWIDRVAAGVIGALGFRLILTAPQN